MHTSIHPSIHTYIHTYINKQPWWMHRHIARIPLALRTPRPRGAERKVRESVSPVSMDEYTRWLYDWPTRSAGAADAAKQVDRVGCCSPCCHAQRLAKGSAYSFVPRILEDEDTLEMLRRRHWEPAECPRARGACFISEALAMGALP